METGYGKVITMVGGVCIEVKSLIWETGGRLESTYYSAVKDFVVAEVLSSAAEISGWASPGRFSKNIIPTVHSGEQHLLQEEQTSLTTTQQTMDSAVEHKI